MAANDEAYLTLRLSDDGGTQTEFSRISWFATDVADTSEDGRLDFSVMTAGSLAKELRLDGTSLAPSTSDGNALGTLALMWSDLFLASGGVMNWDNGGVTITENLDTLQFAGAMGYTFSAALRPASGDGAALGGLGSEWSDLYLASGAVVDFGTADVLMTHSSNLLAFTGATSGYTFDVPIGIASGGTNSNASLNNQRVMTSVGGAIVESGAITDGEGIQRNNTTFISAPLPLSTAEGRLTLTSTVPVTTADVTGASTIYFTPYHGDRISVYDGTRWKAYKFTELSLALGTLINAQNYDVFIYDNSGTLTLEATEWASATVTMTIAAPGVVTWTGHGMSSGNSITFTTTGALPTGVTADTQYWITVVDANTFRLSTSLINQGAGTLITTSGSQSGTHTGHQPQARQTALTTQNGVQVKSGATTRRYLGTFMTTSTTTTEDSVAKRFVWNNHNRIERVMSAVDTTNTWTYSTAAYRQSNNSSANQVAFILGLSENAVNASVSSAAASSTSTYRVVRTGVGLDSTITNSATTYDIAYGNNVQVMALKADYRGYPSLGYHALVWIEYGNGTDTQTWYGDGTSTTQQGILGNIRN
jgi:hypothetical protein